MDRTAEIAWAAGLFEGEGCITRTRGYPAVSLGMTDLDVVNRFAAVVGVGRRHVSTTQRTKPMYFWTCGRFEDVQYIVGLFWRFLGERRRNRAREVLLANKARPKRRIATDDHCAQGHPWTLETQKVRRGFPSCRICERKASSRARYARKRRSADLHPQLFRSPSRTDGGD